VACDDRFVLERSARNDIPVILRVTTWPDFTKNGLVTGMHAHKQAALLSAAPNMMKL
jgi:hypothetical protein